MIYGDDEPPVPDDAPAPGPFDDFDPLKYLFGLLLVVGTTALAKGCAAWTRGQVEDRLEASSDR